MLEKKIIDFLIGKPEMIVTILSGFLLPIILVWLNNYYNLKSKSREKQIDEKYNVEKEIKTQEKSVYSSLSKILFDAQQLHVALSGSCVDRNCIDEAVTKFDVSITNYHQEISNNLLYMPSVIINLIYKFYGKISDLKISLKEFNDTKNYAMAHVSVYLYSADLAETLIEIQEKFVSKNDALVKDFDRTQQEMMKYCCGRKPPKDLFNNYIELITQIKPGITEADINDLTRRWKL